MKESARKYSKILYFVKDRKYKDLVIKKAERPTKRNINKHYPYNCISRFYPLDNLSNNQNLLLPCGFKTGESWGALRKCWIGYKRAKADDDEILMREYAGRIQKVEEELGIPTASFPNLGMLGDIFFLYDKEKEQELRQQYMHDNIVCDRYDVDNINELVEKGEAKEFDNMKQVKNYMDHEHYKGLVEHMMQFANDEHIQGEIRAVQRKWNAREKVATELRHIKQELGALRMSHLDKEDQIRIKRRKEYLMQQKVLKESELNAVETINLVKTDEGWKFAKEILENSWRQKIKYDYEPKYYLTDHRGRRLGNYKEEQEEGWATDPYFYRLYLEDKEWHDNKKYESMVERK